MQLEKQIDNMIDEEIEGDKYTEEMVNLLGNLGYYDRGRSYRREESQAFKKLVTEVYSPPRVNEELMIMLNDILAPGWSFDITCTDPVDGKRLYSQLPPLPRPRLSTSQLEGPGGAKPKYAKVASEL